MANATALARNPLSETAALGVDGLASAPPVVETRGLRKTYGGVVALDRMDLTIPRAAVGLLGPNGAGKTTLLKLLLGLSRPTEGSASVLGFDTRTQGIAIRERVGYMPESDALPPGTTAADFVGHMAEMSGLPAREARQRAADVLYQVGLDEERYRLIKGFSTGMKQRVKLAQAIVHDPGLVFLDEPTNGMDPQGREEMLELIIRIHRMLGMAVIVSSHILEDIERVCDYVVIVNGGRLVLAQPIASEIGTTSTDLLVRVDGDPGAFIARLGQDGLQAGPSRDDEAWALGEIVVRFDGERTYDAVRDAAVELGVALRSLRTRARTLEDLYLGNIEGDGATDGASDGRA
ncbi:MAG: type transport system ATP-binding protein [Thermomicrobiales bacterium]|jgi:ABC-2 type transport system ATP-binding protein|nr:type transport system ATP-binding protein [Thermomicrobiales bacterium]MEA2526938.1 type transport system ATP-binding protein [Thermomicrobiales bacterium]MEA2597035.1 type transport system ATP-binding protein [Thermomicrobiales bacterium]